MIQIQQAVADWLGRKTGVRAVAGRSPVQAYPLFTVEAELSGVTALAGGRQCEERFSVTVTAASDRDRDQSRALLARLALALPAGIPMDDRVLRPEDVSTKGDALCFSLTLCRLCPTDPEEEENAEVMEHLHFDV